MKKNFSIVALTTGIIFIISAFSKAISFNYFSSIISNYCSFYTDIIAMIVIVAELILGIMFFFGIALKFISIISFFMIFLFSLIYTYGFSFLNIQDCGCFGKVQFFNTSPAFLYIRNTLLLLGMLYVYKTSKNTTQTYQISISNYIATIIVISFAIYLCGQSSNNYAFKRVNKSDKRMAYRDHILSDYINVSADSTYLIYAFSYDCPHCINSFGNLSQYNNPRYVDKVIGICKENLEAKKKFIDFFNPSFEIKEIPEQEFYNITEKYPTSFFVKRDSIIKIVEGEIPSAYFLTP